VALGVAPALDVRLARSFDLRGSAMVSTSASVDVANGSADVNIAAARLDGCGALRAGAARLRGCVGAIGGVVAAEGSGFRQTYTTNAPWIGPAVRLDGRWGFGQTFGLLLSVNGFLPGLRPRLDVLARDGSVAVSRSFPLAGVVVGLGP